MYKLVLFDLDGTLLNSLKDLAYASNYALKQFGFETYEEEAYKRFVGNGVYKLVERMLPVEERKEETLLEVKKVFDSYYKEHNLDYTQPYEGVMALLQEMQEKGIQTAVVSNKPHDFAQELVKQLFKEKISVTYGQREGIKTKPDPTTVLEVIEHFKRDKKECIYVGDSDVDMLTAKNAGIHSIGVLWGFRTEEELKEAGADFIAKDTNELLKYILKTNVFLGSTILKMNSNR